jgi:hypothetical protein
MLEITIAPAGGAGTPGAGVFGLAGEVVGVGVVVPAPLEELDDPVATTAVVEPAVAVKGLEAPHPVIAKAAIASVATA